MRVEKSYCICRKNYNTPLYSCKLKYYKCSKYNIDDCLKCKGDTANCANCENMMAITEDEKRKILDMGGSVIGVFGEDE